MKDLFKQIRFGTCLVAGLFFFIAVLPVQAYKLELQDSAIIIPEIGQQQKDGKFKMLDGNKTDSIRIDEIVLSYDKDTRAEAVLYVILEGDTIFSEKIKNSLSNSELNGKGISFITNKNYQIKHGEKTWTLKFTSTPEATVVDETPKTSEEKGEKPEESGSSKNGISWLWLIAVAVVTALLSAFATIWVIKRIKNLKGPSGKTKDGDESVKEQEEPIIQVTVPQIQEKAIADFLDDLNVENNNDIEDRKNRLKTQLKEARETKELVDNVCALLEGIDKRNIIQKIRDLKEKADSPVPQPLPKNNDCEKLIDHIKNKNDQQIRDAFNEAKDKCLEPFETLKQFINILPSKCPKQVNPLSERKPFKDELNSADPNIRNTIKTWLLDKIDGGQYINKQRDDLSMIFDKIKQLLCAPQSGTEEEIVSKAIRDNKLSAEDKRILLCQLINTINAQIDENLRISTEDDKEFVNLVAERLSMPSTKEEARCQVEQEYLEIINEIFGGQLERIDKDEIEKVLADKVKRELNGKIQDLEVSTLDELVDKVKELRKEKDKVTKFLKNYSVKEVGQLPQAVITKKDNSIIDNKKDEINQLIPDATITSVENLINQLINAVKDAKREEQKANENSQLIEQGLTKKLKSIATDSKPLQDDLTALELLDKYSEAVEAREKNLNGQIKAHKETIGQKNGEIAELEGQVKEKENENRRLQSKRDELEASIKQAGQRLVDDLHAKADLIVQSYRPFINPCSDADESNCEDIDDRLYTQVNKAVERLKEYQVGTDQKPAEIRKAIQKLLLQELDVDNSPFNTICRYYAYSRLPFMTDKTREYGIIFDRKNMAELFMAVDNLLVQFGINLDIPALFATGFAEGDYEDVTGKKYSDLDNLCPNSRNHFDNIDSKSKPEKVIVDMVQVGYSVDGKPSKKTSVLTF